MTDSALLTDSKAGQAVGVWTLGSGLAMMLDLIPESIGKLATLVGIVLSLVLIYTHLRKGAAEHKKLDLESQILIRQLERLEQEIVKRDEN